MVDGAPRQMLFLVGVLCVAVFGGQEDAETCWIAHSAGCHIQLSVCKDTAGEEKAAVL